VRSVSACFFIYLKNMSTMDNISDVYQADRKPSSLMLKAGMLQDQSQQDRCTLATLSEALKKFGLVPWPVGRLAFKDVWRAARAAYRSPFVRCKSTQCLGCAVPWNRAILRSLSARRMLGPHRNRIPNRKAVKVSCISFFQEVELRPSLAFSERFCFGSCKWGASCKPTCS
jgi:hypothetical protein